MQLVLPSAIHGHRRLLNHAATTTEINYKHRVVDRRQPRLQPTSIIRHKDRFIRANRTRAGPTYFGYAIHTSPRNENSPRRETLRKYIVDAKFSCNHIAPSLTWNRFSGHSINKLWILLLEFLCFQLLWRVKK